MNTELISLFVDKFSDDLELLITRVSALHRHTLFYRLHHSHEMSRKQIVFGCDVRSPISDVYRVLFFRPGE